jgi:hypothetical protein
MVTPPGLRRRSAGEDIRQELAGRAGRRIAPARIGRFAPRLVKQCGGHAHLTPGMMRIASDAPAAAFFFGGARGGPKSSSARPAYSVRRLQP